MQSMTAYIPKLEPLNLRLPNPNPKILKPELFVS